MGKPADLKDLAYGPAAGFISRNNDLDGYRAPGKLQALAQARGVNPLNQARAWGLTDDRGRAYRCEALSACRPHDPARERRSTRARPE